MEPHTAHSLFLLNIVFMAACKHLGKSTYIKRAIQFRERARGKYYLSLHITIKLLPELVFFVNNGIEN